MKYFTHVILHSEMKAMQRVTPGRRSASLNGWLHLCAKPKFGKLKLAARVQRVKAGQPAIRLLQANCSKLHSSDDN
jgi:hypothetical protein